MDKRREDSKSNMVTTLGGTKGSATGIIRMVGKWFDWARVGKGH